MTLASLLALQDHDTLVDQARHRRAHLPEATQLRDLELACQALVARRAELVATQADLVSRQDAIERDVTGLRSKQAGWAKRLAATAVPREAQTYQSEIDNAHQRQVELEDAELELMEQLEPIEAELSALDARVSALDAELVDARAALATREAEGDAELAALAAGRGPLADAVGPEAFASYELKRPKLGGVAVARLVAGTCTGCNMRVSSGELQRLQHLSADETAECEQCGRLLVV
jgi:uncharacterized protein